MKPLKIYNRQLVTILKKGAFILFLGVFFAAQAHGFQSDEQIENHGKQTLLRGLTLMRTGFPDKAVDLFAEGLKVSPQNIALLAAMSDAHKSLGDMGLASFYLNRAVQIDSTNISLLEQAIQLANESGNAAESIKLSNQIVLLQPQNLRAHLNHLDRLISLQQVIPASNQVMISLQRFENSDVLLRLGLDIFLAAGQLEEAKTAALKLATDSEDAEMWYQLATIEVRLGETEEALGAVERLFDIDPFHERGRLLENELRTGTPGAIGLDKESAFFGVEVPIETQALTLRESGEYTSLLALALSEIDLDPRKLDMWDHALESSFQLGEHQNTLNLAQDGVLLFPGYAPLLYHLARAYYFLGQYDVSQTQAELAVQHAGSDPSLTKKLNLLLADLKKHQ